MFDPIILAKLAKKNKKVLKQLSEIEEELNKRFQNLEEPIRAPVLSVASGEPLLFIGPPGTVNRV